MGFGGISPWSLLLILIIVVLLFGTKRLKNIGADLGAALKSFRQSMTEGEQEAQDRTASDEVKVATEPKQVNPPGAVYEAQPVAEKTEQRSST